MKSLITTFILLQLIGASLLPTGSSLAQAGGEDGLRVAGMTWGTPVNLSHSGSASAPRLLAASDGRLLAFWWDQYDGMLMSAYDPGAGDLAAWSPPVVVVLPTSAIESMPTLVVDTLGFVHMFWLETGDERQSSLMHSRSNWDSNSWTEPELLARYALVYDVIALTDGEMFLAYIRTEQAPGAPAGLYVKRYRWIGVNRDEWTVGQNAYGSAYYRGVPADKAYIRLATTDLPSGGKLILLSSNYPYTGAGFTLASIDSGKTWQLLAPPASSGGTLSNLRYFSSGVDRRLVRLWQVDLGGACQVFSENQVDWNAFDTQAGTLVPDLSLIIWDSLQEVAIASSQCAANDVFWQAGERTTWISGVGTEELQLAYWDPHLSSWSEPASLAFSFDDPEVERNISLTDLHPVVASGRIAVIGVDPAAGDAWLIWSQENFAEGVFFPDHPWSSPQRISQGGILFGEPVFAVDSEGKANLLWSGKESQVAGNPSLFYTRSLPGATYASVNIPITAEDGYPVHPDWVIRSGEGNNGDILYLVWTDAKDGVVYYSQALAQQAASLDGWSIPKGISGPQAADQAKLTMDAAGRLFVSYIVSLNENRGVYLVTSADGGNWTPDVEVFNAAAAGWQMVDEPALAVTGQGDIILAWAKKSLPTRGESLGVYTSISVDGGVTWSNPEEIAGEGFSSPRLAATGDLAHLFLFQEQGGRILHRTATFDQSSPEEFRWKPATTLQGFQGVNRQFSVASTLQRAFVAGYQEETGALVFSSWERDGDQGKWSPSETISPLLIPELYAGEMGGTTTVALSVQAETGKAVIAWSDPREGWFYDIFRSIEVEEASPAAVLEPTDTPAPASVAAPLPQTSPTIEPTATLSLPLSPTSADSSIPPMVWGGAAAGIIVACIFLAWVFISRNPFRQ